MRKMFDEIGNITAEGKQVALDLTYGLSQLMTSDEVNAMSEIELRILGSYLAKLVGEAVSTKISKKLQVESSFSSMDDDEFEAYLKEKYGSIWKSVSLTEEEYKRLTPISEEQINELLNKNYQNINNLPCDGVRLTKRF